MSTCEPAKDYFNRIAGRFSENYRCEEAFEERRRLWQRLIGENLSRLDDGGLCFDMGCGDGSLSRSIAALGFNTIGIDQSDNMLVLARRQAEAEQLASSYMRASLPLSPELVETYRGTAGLILCSSVLEYVDDYEYALTQFHAILRQGGRLILSVPNGDSIYRMGERLFRPMLINRDSYLKYQKHQFRPVDLRLLMLRLGYSVVEEQYFALPLQRYSARIFGRYRGRRLATLYLLVAEK